MDDFLVVGAGIVGLATARALLLRQPGASLTVLDKADGVATAQSGHNSGVVHAGVYYAPGSLKARLCAAGARATKEFCDAHQIAYRTVGKLVVAVDDAEVARLEVLGERARAAGVDLEAVDAAGITALEPAVVGRAALLSPTTAVVDFAEVARALAVEVEAAGGTVRLGVEVRGVAEDGARVLVTTTAGDFRARRLVVCGGLQADRLARMAGLGADFATVPFRGEYFTLPARRSGLVSRLVYPVPDPALPFLGVHLGPTIGGRVTVGPSAVLGLAREGYQRGAVDAMDAVAIAGFGGTWRLAARQWRAGVGELARAASRRAYLRACRRYCPELTVGDLGQRFVGIRAQAVLRDGTLVDDFLVRSTARQTHVCNAPSPAATAALPIGELVAGRALGAG